MLDRLKLVYGAVHERSLMTVLSHVFIYNGRVQATDGKICIDAAFPELKGLNAVAPADRFLAAIEGSDSDPRIELQEGRIVIASGPFRARIPTREIKEFPKAEPDPPDWELDGELLPMLKRLRPFMANDAMNIWSTSLLFTQRLAIATNNVCMIGEPCSLLEGTKIKSIAVPHAALDEVMRMGEEPTAFGVSENSVTFYFDDTWIKSQLILAPWPIDKATELYDTAPKKMERVPEGLAKAVAKIMPFCKDDKFPIILLGANGVATEDHVHQAEVTGIDLPTMRFNGDMLSLMLKSADHLYAGKDDKMYYRVGPARGIIMGLRS